MQTFIEKYLQNELHRSNLRNVLLGWLLGIVSIVLVLMTSLYFIRLNDSRPILNCGSFNSYADALQALPANHKLDRNHNGIPCERLYYHG